MRLLKRVLTVLCLLTLFTGVLVVMPALAEEDAYGIESEAVERTVIWPKTPKAALYKDKHIRITWTKVKDATEYLVYRKEPGGAYKKIGVKKGLGFVDTKAKAGTPYYYAIRVRTADGLSQLSSGRGYIVLKKPVVMARRFRHPDYAIAWRLTWKAVPGATYYRQYARNGTYVGYAAITEQDGICTQEYLSNQVDGYRIERRISAEYRERFKVIGPKSNEVSIYTTAK